MAARKFATRPDHVFIGTNTWAIEWLNDTEWAEAMEDVENDGVTRAVRQIIRIRCQTHASDGRLRDILIHELCHAIWDNSGLSSIEVGQVDREVSEENIVALFSPSLLFVLKHNPELVAWLTQ